MSGSSGAGSSSRIRRSGCHNRGVAKRRRRRSADRAAPTAAYADPEGNVLVLRQTLSAASVAKIGPPPTGQDRSTEDAWHRRAEMLFERLAVSWEIAGLPLTDQAMLLGRYRMADADTQRWVRRTIDAHLERHLPELL